MKKRMVIALAVMCLFFVKMVHAECDDISNEIFAENACTKIRTYRSAEVTEQPILVVALHGDSPFNNPGYQYRFAMLVANLSSNVISVGLLRPGYMDHMGRISDGGKGDAIGNNYDEERVTQVAEAVTELMKIHAPAKVILSGHSGGAAIVANVISLFPFLIDHAFLVSCPCDVNAWREDMFALTHKSIFKGNMETLSSVDLVDKLHEKTIISNFAGKDDTIARPELSEKHEKVSMVNGSKVTLELVDGAHDIFLSAAIIDSITDITAVFNGIISTDIKPRS